MRTSHKIIALCLLNLYVNISPIIYIALVFATQNLMASTAASLIVLTGIGILYNRLAKT